MALRVKEEALPCPIDVERPGNSVQREDEWGCPLTRLTHALAIGDRPYFSNSRLNASAISLT